MFSSITTKLVCDFLLSLARSEKKIELIREKLCEIEEFEPYASFRRIDRSCKNYIDEEDIKQFLQDNEIFFDEDIVKNTFLQHYDYDSDGKLCYAEYLRSLLPCDQPGLRTLVTQRPTYQVNSDELLEKNVETSLSKFLEAEILCYINLDSQKKEISYSGDFSCEALFNEIDKDQIGFIDFQNLNEYFKANMYYPYEEEIISILRRMDKNDDGRLTLSELLLGFKVLAQKEYKKPDLKSLYSTPMVQNEKNLSNSKNINNTANKHVKQSSINYLSSNTKKPASPYVKNGGSIYRSPISKRNNEDDRSDSYSKITTKYEKYETSANKVSTVLPSGNVGNVNAANVNLLTSNIIASNLANESMKSPSKYTYYPYEPIRKAFSPMKEQIMKSSNLEGSPKLLPKANISLEKSQAALVEKYNSYRGKYNNEYKLRSPNMNFSKNEENSARKYESNFKNEVINYFKKLVHFEGEIEKSKQDLFFRPDFNLFDLYMVFDKEKKGYCFLNDFEQTFKMMNLNISGKESLLFFKKFEKNNCGRLRLAEFSKVFAPILLEGQPQTERRSINNEGQFDYFELFSAETRRLISSLLKMHLDYEITIESQRDFISNRERSNLQEIFDQIDSNKDGLIDFYEMKAFLENEGNFSDKDITLLNERMNPVINGKISYEDFRNELRPHL